MAELQLSTDVAQRLQLSKNLAYTCDLLSDAMMAFAISRFLRVEKTATGATRWRAVHNPIIHSREYYEAALKAFWTDVRGQMFYDPMPVASIALLRTSIELKLREAIGVDAFTDPQACELKPVTVNQIFRLVTELRVESIVSLAAIKRIYVWCNLVLHAGLRAEVPEMWYALQYLRPFLRGAPFGKYQYTANPIWSRASDEKIEEALRREMAIPAEWKAIKKAREAAG